MMDSIKLRNNFHTLIDSIKNDAFLNRFYEIMNRAKNRKEGSLIGRLTPSEHQELMSSYEESEDDSNLLDHKDVRSKYEGWL